MVEKKLEELGLVLPAMPKAVANYLAYKVVGNTVIISGQLPVRDGEFPYTGKIGKELSLEEGMNAARLCGLNILAHLKNAVDGDWNRVKQCVRLGGFVNAIDGFKDHPKVINGVSDLMVDVFGDKGRHARAAVGVGSLPLNVCVEVEAMFEIE